MNDSSQPCPPTVAERARSGHSNRPSESTWPPRVTISPWVDPAVDANGHDPRGRYFERYWLAVVGPTATMAMRRFADLLDEAPSGYLLDLSHCAASMGLSFRAGTRSPFGRALQRCVMFGLARRVSDGLVVRRFVPDIARRHLARLPDDVQQQHAQWAASNSGTELGDLTSHLLSIGIPPALARRAAEATLVATERDGRLR